MKDYKAVLFDLDGTITDPKVGITSAVQHALAKSGIVVDDIDTLTPFIGPPLSNSFKEFYGFNDQDAKRAVEYYREYFSAKGMYENEVYPGMQELLQALRGKGCRVLVATSKPSVFARKILKHFGLYKYIDCIVGSYLDGRRMEKDQVVRYAVKWLRDMPREAMVMVGDRKFDVLGARAHGIDSIAVAFGYGSVEELESCEPTRIAHTVEELKSLLLGTE